LIGLVYFSVRGFGSSQAAILTALAVLGMLVLCTALSLRRMQRAT
jgi:hypothetical protein